MPNARSRAAFHEHCNCKLKPEGGVGKTTGAANLASALAEHGKRVLAIDIDPQARRTFYTGLSVAEFDHAEKRRPRAAFVRVRWSNVNKNPGQ